MAGITIATVAIAALLWLGIVGVMLALLAAAARHDRAAVRGGEGA